MSLAFVLDASVAIRWVLHDGSAADRAYADRVLDALVESSAHVPALWHTELVHVLRCAEDDAKIGESAIASYFARLNRLPIETDPTAPRALSASAATSRATGVPRFSMVTVSPAATRLSKSGRWVFAS